MTAKPKFLDGKKRCKSCDGYFPPTDKFFSLKKNGKTISDDCLGCHFLKKKGAWIKLK